MRLLEVKKKTAVLELLRHQFTQIAPPSATTELLAIEQAVGRTLAADVFSTENMPEFKRSTVDGYAVRAIDTTGCSESIPAFLTVIGESAMGEATNIQLAAQQALRVPTGGMVPDGADAVVMLEYTELMEQQLAIFRSIAPRENVIDIGDDVRAGEILFARGKRLEARHIGTLAMLGCRTVLVRNRPTIGIISAGDELVSIGERPKTGQVRDVNGLNLAVFAQQYGGEVLSQCLVPDDDEQIGASLSAGIATCDIVLISGGSSVGDGDHTAEIINSLGAPGVLVHGVAIKPGKPTIVAQIADKFIFGLPGHPAACIMAFLAIVAPFMQSIVLENNIELNQFNNVIEAKSGFQLHGGQGRDVFQFVKIEREAGVNVAYPLNGKSGMLSLLAQADGYIELSMDCEGICVGEQLSVKLF